jgi:hypothetical protein
LIFPLERWFWLGFTTEYILSIYFYFFQKINFHFNFLLLLVLFLTSFLITLFSWIVLFYELFSFKLILPWSDKWISFSLIAKKRLVWQLFLLWNLNRSRFDLLHNLRLKIQREGRDLLSKIVLSEANFLWLIYPLACKIDSSLKKVGMLTKGLCCTSYIIFVLFNSHLSYFLSKRWYRLKWGLSLNNHIQFFEFIVYESWNDRYLYLLCFSWLLFILLVLICKNLLGLDIHRFIVFLLWLMKKKNLKLWPRLNSLKFTSNTFKNKLFNESESKACNVLLNKGSAANWFKCFFKLILWLY